MFLVIGTGCLIDELVTPPVHWGHSTIFISVAIYGTNMIRQVPTPSPITIP